jgi:hypothetical protein
MAKLTRGLPFILFSLIALLTARLSTIDSYAASDVISALHIQRLLKLAKSKINGPGGAAELLSIHPNTLRKRMDDFEFFPN